MKSSLTMTCLCLLGTATTAAAANELSGMGSLSGKVVAEKPFLAAKVYAHDESNGVTYMVYTDAGRYRAVNLFPGTYEVTVQKPGFVTDAKRVVIEAGGTATADFALREAPLKETAVGDRASQATVLASYAEIYPPGPGREIAERTCIRCHGVNWIPARPQPEAAWNAILELMLNLTDDAAWGVKNGTPLIPPGTISPEERATILKYLAQHFGADKVPRAVRIDTPPELDEAALGKAMWIEYSVSEPKAENGQNRWIQETFFDLQGNVWLTERTRGAAAILKLDPRTATFTAFPTPNPNWSPHGIIVDPIDGSVWWAGRGVHIARLDPQTGETREYPLPPEGGYGGHTPAFDSTGDIWFSMLPDDHIGRWDRETDRIKRWQIPTKGGRPYGLLVDHNDKVWFAEFYSCKITRFDPVTEKFTQYTAPSAPCTIRRLGLDSGGKIWYGAFSAGKLGVIDPATGRITEYPISPISEPYDTWVDPEDNVWMGDGAQGGVLIKFDQKTQRFTNYPSPVRSDMPKLSITRDGAIWYSNRSYASAGVGPATVGVLYPDMSRMKTLGAYFAVRNGRTVGPGSPPPAKDGS